MAIVLNMKKMLAIYIYERRSIIRKLFGDWGLSISLSRLRMVLLLIGVLLPTSIFLTSFFLKNYIERAEFLSFAFLLLIIHLLSQSFGFYQHHKTYFLLDKSKVFQFYKEFRSLRLLSKIFEESIKHTIIYWCIMFLPFYLGMLHDYSFKTVVMIFLSTCIYLFGSVFLHLFFSYVLFLFSKLFQTFMISNLLSFCIFIVTCFFLFWIPFSVLSYLLKQEDHMTYFSHIIDGSFFSYVDMQTYISLEGKDILTNVGVLSFVINASIFMILIWVLTLRKTDLLEYKNSEEKFKPRYKETPFFKKKSPFFVKDFIYLTRLNEWWWEHLGRTFTVLSFLTGVTLPIIHIFFSSSSPLYFVTITVLCSIYIYQIVGDSLRILLAIDREAKNMNLFMHRTFTLWELVKEKLKIYQYFVLGSTLFIFLITLLFTQLHPLKTLLVLCLSYSFGYLSGLIQLSTTALFPKKNWEHVYEIGESHKASTYNDGLNTTLIVIYTAIPTFLYFTEKHSLIPFSIMAISIVILLVILTLIGYLLTKLYLTKIELKEVFFNND